MISSSMRKLHYGLFDNAANQRAPGQLQLDDFTRPSPWGSLHVVFSISADASHMPCCRTDCKVALSRSVVLSYPHLMCAGLFIT